jgi:hypothetical protein
VGPLSDPLNGPLSGFGPPPPVDLAMALDDSEVESRIVIAGGTVIAKRPHVCRKLRRSSSSERIGGSSAIANLLEL